MTIENNLEFKDASPSQVTILIPHGIRDMWTLLLRDLNEKRTSFLHVKLGKPRKPRTTGEFSQNHHLNGHVAQIANWTGDSFDDTKSHIKREAIADGYPFYTDSFGKVHPQSESECSTVECALLIEAAHRVASFAECILKEE